MSLEQSSREGHATFLSRLEARERSADIAAGSEAAETDPVMDVLILFVAVMLGVFTTLIVVDVAKEALRSRR